MLPWKNRLGFRALQGESYSVNHYKGRFSWAIKLPLAPFQRQNTHTVVCEYILGTQHGYSGTLRVDIKH